MHFIKKTVTNAFYRPTPTIQGNVFLKFFNLDL